MVLAAGADGETVRLEIERRLQEGFDLHHTTLQVERSDRSEQEHIHGTLGGDSGQDVYKRQLEYFGGKRTGDLISRIGSETDRICVFLSLHLLDFANDILMIAMTAAILVSINPWLALVTPVPLPFIIWMIHAVRDRLRHGFEKVCLLYTSGGWPRRVRARRRHRAGARRA